MNINTRVFPRLFSIALTTSLGVGVSACSQADGNSPDVGTDTSSSSASTSGTSSATSTTTSNSSTTTSSASSSTSSATSTAATSTSTATTSTATTTSQATSSNSSEATSTAAGSSSATSSSGGDSSDTGTSGDTSSNESSGDATSSDGTTSGVAEEDFVPLEEHFTCINDWENGPGFRITNVLGKTAEALAVANSEEGGTYPVGTIVQHLPTEAMVKRHTGFSPETKDWEFYVLTPMNGANTFVDHGPDITTMGNTCASCHLKADEPWDFICNTSKDHGGTACATFDFPQEMRDMTAANAAPCMQ